MSKELGQEPENLAETYSNLFDKLSGTAALTKINELSLLPRGEAERHPEYYKIVRSVAGVSDQDIITWANNMTTDGDPRTMSFYFHKAQDFRDQCAAALGLPDTKDTVQ